MLSKSERLSVKKREVEEGISAGLSPASVSNLKIDVRVHRGGLLKVYVRDTLKKTRTREGQS